MNDSNMNATFSFLTLVQQRSYVLYLILLCMCIIICQQMELKKKRRNINIKKRVASNNKTSQMLIECSICKIIPFHCYSFEMHFISILEWWSDAMNVTHSMKDNI